MTQGERIEPIAKSRRRIGSLVVGGLGLVVLAVAMFGAWRSLPTQSSATPPAADPAPALRPGPLLAPHHLPRMLPDIGFEDRNGLERSLADFRGKVLLLNVWATWCAPCRAEMPTLDRLQGSLGSKDFEVVALSIDRDGQAAVKHFFRETHVQSLGIYVDKSSEALTRLGIVGVPTTLLVDRDGREVARHTGPAVWDSPGAIDAISRYLPKRRQ